MASTGGGGGGGTFEERPESGESSVGVRGSVTRLGEPLMCCDNVRAVRECDCRTSI